MLPDAVEMSQSLAAAIFGTCAAWDAAQRDVSVLLITNSFRMMHGGGVRYLQHANVRPMRRAKLCSRRTGRPAISEYSPGVERFEQSVASHIVLWCVQTSRRRVARSPRDSEGVTLE